MKIAAILAVACAAALGGCASSKPVTDAAPPPPSGVRITFSDPDFGTGSQYVYAQNDGDSYVTVRYQYTIAGKPGPVNSIGVMGHSKETLGRTCAFDVWGQPNVCGSIMSYRLL
jgi:hypothetical protein